MNRISRLCLLLGLIGVVWLSGCGAEVASEIVQKPVQGDFEVLVTVTGELRAKSSVSIQGPVGARRMGIYQTKITRMVPEGTYVQEGDFVADLDKTDLLGKMKEVEINLQKFQSQYTQVRLDCTLTLAQARDELINLDYALEQKKLEKEESIYEAPSTRRQIEIEYEKSDRAYKQAVKNYETKVQKASAEMREAEADLSKEQKKYDDYIALMDEFSVKAPSNGMVIYKREYDGKKRAAGSSLMLWDPTVATLPDLSLMESVTYVNEVDIRKIKKGQVVRISLDAEPDKKLSGKVTQVANIGEQRENSDSKVFEVIIEITEKDSTLRPAMTTSNEIIIDTREDVMYIPLETVHTEDSITYVYAKDGGSVVKQEVIIGLTNDNYGIVETGLGAESELLLSVPENAAELDMNRLSPGSQPTQNAAEAKL